MKVFILLAVIFFNGFFQMDDKSSFRFQPGDLLFQDLDCGELCDAIEKVTEGINGRSFSHIGIVYLRHDSVFVIEAIGKDVHLTYIREFLSRARDENHNPKTVVSRLKKKFQPLNSKALEFAIRQVGIPYDDIFMYNNGKYYCSELIYDAYKTANHNQPFFLLQPMTFKDRSTRKIFPAWEKYYSELKTEVPEGKPGCNPGLISRDEKLEIVKMFY